MFAGLTSRCEMLKFDIVAIVRRISNSNDFTTASLSLYLLTSAVRAESDLDIEILCAVSSIYTAFNRGMEHLSFNRTNAEISRTTDDWSSGVLS